MIDYNYGVKLDRLKASNIDFYRDNRNKKEIWQYCRQNTLLSTMEHARWFDAQSQSANIKMFEIVPYTLNQNTAVDARWFDAQSQSANQNTTEAHCLTNIEIENNDPVGVCGLTDIDYPNSRAEFSCWISPDFQRFGYATSALKTLFVHGFFDLNLNQIWGETFDKNPALSLFTEKLKMAYDGTRRRFYFRDGEYIDSHLVSLLRSEAFFLKNKE